MKRAAVLLLCALGCTPSLNLGELTRCHNGETDGDESDVDCGGELCDRCGPRKHCAVEDDCFSALCPTSTHVCSCSSDMVEVDVDETRAYCIDKLEVTNADYREFVEDPEREVEVPDECAWDADLRPAGARFGRDDDPVVNIDQCDALLFCQWYGKRLCGAIGGGASFISDFRDAARSQWFLACASGDGTLREFPYGGAYRSGACNGDNIEDAIINVGTSTSCQGSRPDLWDMSGNVWEWEDSCEDGIGEEDACRIRGGAFDSFEVELSCGADNVAARSDTEPNIGFRCCAG